MPHPCFNKNICEVDLDVLVKRMKVGDYAPVSGGFSSARRGIVRLPDGRSFFAKQATCEHTARWLEKEAAIYPSQFKFPFFTTCFFEGYIAKPEGGAKNIYTAHMKK